MGSNTATAPAQRSLISDRIFWLAIAAGPVVWTALYSLNPVPFAVQKIVEHWWRLLLLAGFYPLLEEWLFRGLLQPQLLRYRTTQAQFMGFTVANVLTTGLFVAAHFIAQPPLWALLVAIPSLIFGWFRDRYQSVIPSIILHSIYNLGYFVLFLPSSPVT